jgi:hypothetical protein
MKPSYYLNYVLDSPEVSDADTTPSSKNCSGWKKLPDLITADSLPPVGAEHGCL